MPLPPAEMVPLLLMPPAKVETVAELAVWAKPPTMMPLSSAAIVPLLLMPPAKVEIATEL